MIKLDLKMETTKSNTDWQHQKVHCGNQLFGIMEQLYF